MEDLLKKVEDSCSITSDDINPIVKRKLQFKYGGRTDESAREKRRTQFLEDFKRKREALLNEKRGLIDDEFIDDEEWMDWQEGRKDRGRRWVNHHCKNQLMLSEWLLDRPQDLDTNWTIVLCPEGRRTLVIAKRGCTRAYHKSGLLLAKFKSVLPNGAPHNKTRNSDTIILDCIWKESTNQLFALDVLHWKNQTLLGCDAQFRLYWLKSKLTEVKQTENSNAEAGVNDVFLPSHCSLASLPSVLAEHNSPQVDGVLFYHNSGPYVSGRTPVVGWLKPYMLEERLGVSVPAEYLALQPPDYTDLEHWVTRVSHSHSRRPRPPRLQMETETLSTPEPHFSGTFTCEMEDISKINEDVMDS